MSTHSFVRVDCKAFAKCGVKSLSHCRRYRGEDNYCGHYFYLNRFYANTITSHGKKYRCLSSWCRMCMSQVNSERAKQKKGLT